MSSRKRYAGQEGPLVTSLPFCHCEARECRSNLREWNDNRGVPIDSRDERSYIVTNVLSSTSTGEVKS